MPETGKTGPGKRFWWLVSGFRIKAQEVAKDLFSRFVTVYRPVPQFGVGMAAGGLEGVF